MFVLTVIVSIPLAWVGYQLNWIRQRHAVVEAMAYKTGIADFAESVPPAPRGLWLFGEEGESIIIVSREHGSVGVEKVQRLFPEAFVRLRWDDEI